MRYGITFRDIYTVYTIFGCWLFTDRVKLIQAKDLLREQIKHHQRRVYDRKRWNERLKRSKSVEETAQNRLGFGIKVKWNSSKLHGWYLRLVDDTRYFRMICFDLSPQRSNNLAEQQRPTERKILLAKRQTVIIIGRGKVISARCLLPPRNW